MSSVWNFDPREKKLPVWAQELLKRQRQRTREAQAALKAHLETVEPTSIWYGDYNNPIYIPNGVGSTVHFQIGDRPPGQNNSYDAFMIRHSRSGPGIEINGGHEMFIELTSANWIDLRLK